MKTLWCLDAMAAAESGGVKNMHIFISQLTPGTPHGVVVDDQLLLQSIFEGPWIK